MGNNSWHDEIDFHCTFGAWPFKKSLDITPAGFLYCGELFPLKTITRLRWGVDQKRGGILPKVLYLATFGTATREFTISTSTSRSASGAPRDAASWPRCSTACARAAASSSAASRYRTKGSPSGRRGYSRPDARSPEQPIASASFLWVDNAHILSVALALLQERADKRRLSAIAD